ncbi:hypothetical protein FDENT_10875 [Fusarium denticulatum]|uniref:Uncharacterized protein n=1 Tax=Fusarium denticulatum TaxID=48507 RepID=A0A8H5WTH3_9HYPO|nr:hypothetical protein FDENT_10875 [Fusarium denticulatum]
MELVHNATVPLIPRIIESLLEPVVLFRRYVKGREGLLDRKKWKESVRLGPEGKRFHGVVIICNTYARQGFSDGVPDFHSTKQIRKETKLLDASYIAFQSKDNWKKLFLLQFHHACLRLFFEFLIDLEAHDNKPTALETLENKHADDANTDSGFAELWRWNLRTITRRSYEYRDLGEMSRNLISATESLIEVVRVSSLIVDSTSHANRFMVIDMELRRLCREANERIQSFSDKLDHDLKYLGLARDINQINQSKGVQQLTLLATIFLPLSLAAGVLTMQTRFKDLGTLLFHDLERSLVLNNARMPFMEHLSGMLMHSVLCANHRPERPLNLEDRPSITISPQHFESMITTLRTRGIHTHKAWETCHMNLEQLLHQQADLNVFSVLDAAEDAYNEVILDLKDFSQLQNDAEEDPSVLLRLEADVLVIDAFCTELAKAREVLFGNATSESGEPVERFTGIDKLFTEALPQLQKFFSEQNNTEVMLFMVMEIIQAQGFVEEQGEGKWLQPLKDSLGEALYKQVLEAGAA